MVVSPTTITSDEGEIPNAILINRAALAPFAKFVKQQIVYTPTEPIYRPDDKV